MKRGNIAHSHNLLIVLEAYFLCLFRCIENIRVAEFIIFDEIFCNLILVCAVVSDDLNAPIL